jgi:hypothetical protein
MQKLLVLLFSLLLIPTFANAQRPQDGAPPRIWRFHHLWDRCQRLGVTDWVSLVGSFYTIPAVDHGVQGDTACDLAQHVFTDENPSTPVAGLYTMMIGTNDANNEGSGAYEAVYHSCHLAALSWRTVGVAAGGSGMISIAAWVISEARK